VYDRRVGARTSIPVVAAVCLLLAGCDGIGPAEIQVPRDDAGQSNGGSGGSQSSGGGGAGTGGTTDPSVSPVLVAITPTPASNGSEPSAADAIEADVTTFGAGARAAIVVLPWDEVPVGEDPALKKRLDFYAAHHRRVLVNLAVVDRLADHRPASLADAAWNAPVALEAVHQALDTVFEAGGDAVRFVTFGRDVDLYLAAHPLERAAFVTFAKEACAYARGHAGAAADLAVGVAFSPAAPKSEPSFAQLLEAEDIVAFSYFPGLGTYEADATSGVVATISGLADASLGRPIVLQAAGAPSDAMAGGSEATQQMFFTTLFGAIGARRSSFALASVTELHDAPSPTCAAWVASQGEPPDGPFAAYACSLGVLHTDGAPKPAWSAVIAGAAALSSP
jgi:hypothetical protein